MLLGTCLDTLLVDPLLLPSFRDDFDPRRSICERKSGLAADGFDDSRRAGVPSPVRRLTMIAVLNFLSRLLSMMRPLQADKTTTAHEPIISKSDANRIFAFTRAEW